MSLEPGTSLGPYAVTAKIGEGGMGEVFEASSRDSILPVFNQSPCAGCDVSCCKEYVVQLNGHDLYRLIASVERPLQQYIELRRSKDSSAVLLKDSAEVDFYELTLAHGPRGVFSWSRRVSSWNAAFIRRNLASAWATRFP